MNIKLNLNEVQETALIPLAVKANETKRKHNRIVDKKAIEILETLNIDTKKYDKFFSHEGIIARTILIDKFVKKFINSYPNALVLNIGCGFDDRFSRINNNKLLWYDIDLPSSIKVRQKVYQDRRGRKMYSADILTKGWAKNIEKREKTLIIMEGLLMYFNREQIKTILNNLVENFKDITMICELMHPFAITNGKHHETVKYTGAQFKWGIKTGTELLELCHALQFIKEISISEIMKQYSIRGYLFSLLIGKMNNRIAVYTTNSSIKLLYLNDNLPAQWHIR